ncbi:MAG TPA: glycosyltransferase family 2 protein [Thermoanaerobaculia bacterium]|nr:glycosyltransferase family 2 protein [Thermoanaerobaculia bacterium]
MIVALLLFWICLAVAVYVYFGYPALLWTVSKLRHRPVQEGDVSPLATFVIAAYNEEKNIAAKLANTLTLDYPHDRIEVLVVSNGSTDATNDIVRDWQDPRVRLIVLEQPGKMQALNIGAQQATGEILVFTDADFQLDRQALREIARKFHDPAVGGVCGARRKDARRDGDSTGRGEGLYGRWDRWQKIHESRIGSVFAADGLLYAIRKNLYVPIVDPAQADDIAISARVPLQGYRLLFEPKATAWENAPVHAADEFRRKVRVTNHSVRALLNLQTKLFTSGFYSLELLSHKLIRHFVPLFLIPLLIVSTLLVHVHSFYALMLAAQLAVYALAAIGWILREQRVGRMKLFYVPYFFCFVNAAALLGVLSILRGERKAAWTAQRSVKITRS